MEQRKLKIIFLGRKPNASKALDFLIKKGNLVKAVVAPGDDLLANTAKKFQTPVLEEEQLYSLIGTKDLLVTDVDLVLSYLYPKKILPPLFSLGKLGCVNFHPAPLPDYKGRAGYNVAILEGRKDFGVSAHFIDSEQFDSGPIIEVLNFPIDHQSETAFSLEEKSQEKLLQLFKSVINKFLSGQPIPTKKNEGGFYLTSKQLEDLKIVNLDIDSAEVVERKIRAFFFPPYHGAKARIDGKDFTLISEEILKFLAEKLKK